MDLLGSNLRGIERVKLSAVLARNWTTSDCTILSEIIQFSEIGHGVLALMIGNPGFAAAVIGPRDGLPNVLQLIVWNWELQPLYRLSLGAENVSLQESATRIMKWSPD